MSTFTSNQEAEPGNVFIQIKATDRLQVSQDAVTIPFRVEWADLALWREEPRPVILVVYNVVSETAYWLHVKRFCETLTRLQATHHAGTVTIYLHKDNVLDGNATEGFRQYKRVIFDQTRGKVKHHG